jgi:type II secretory pathway component HofQ
MKIGYRPVSDDVLQLNLLSETSNSKEIAGGYLLLQENCEGSITIGDRFGVPVRDLAGNTVIQFYSSGFKLIITAHSVTGEKAKLNVKFEMSSLDRASALAGRPIISTYESEVEPTLSDGETGIISRRIEAELGTKENVPCYLNVPLIKYLFNVSQLLTLKVTLSILHSGIGWQVILPAPGCPTLD